MAAGNYNKATRIGNWCEEMQCEEEDMKDFLAKMDKGQLLIQKSAGLLKKTTEPRRTTVTNDGRVHFGDRVLIFSKKQELANVAGFEPRPDTVMAINFKQPSEVLRHSEIIGPCDVTASSKTKPALRNIFVITSCDRSTVGETLKYGQQFLIRTAPDAGGLFLQSDIKGFVTYANKSRHHEVVLVKEPTYLAHWEIHCRDPRLRNEYAGYPVRANDEVIIRHSKTNQNLNLEEEYPIRGLYGQEYEISCMQTRDSHKYEKDTNRWILKMLTPQEMELVESYSFKA